MSRDVLESDVVISIPKLKTHEKVGITCGIKGCVGTIAHKDCLAHHRYGPPRQGGDEYPDSMAALQVLSAIHDKAYSADKGPVRDLLHSVDYFSRKVVRRFTRAMSGGWPGNDTCWRMAVDLARIVEHADLRGTLHPEKCRRHLMLTDGIIGGEGNGPLSPRPVPLGMVAFSDNVVWGDYVNCLSMGFDPDRIPMIREAFLVDEFPLADREGGERVIQANGRTVSTSEYRAMVSRKFRPPREWSDVL
jgi:hypothetical protein